MKSKFFRSPLIAARILTLIFLALGTFQVAPAAAQGPDKVTVGKDYKHDVSPPLREIKPVVAPPKHEHEANVNPHINSAHQDQLDPVVQSTSFAAAIPSPILNFNGI